MSITFNIASYLQPYTGGKEGIKVEGNSVRECLNDLIRQFPTIKKRLLDENGNLLDYVSVFAGEDVAYADQLDKPVKDGDVLHILYIIGGG
ncbi:MAG: MoaD/ThiS family protein [Dehalococcoidales bacterium]|nr:MoaD/ThiS family protein [Dehalococcoidales bacterium]